MGLGNDKSNELKLCITDKHSEKALSISRLFGTTALERTQVANKTYIIVNNTPGNI